MSPLPKPTFLPLKKGVQHVVQACQASLKDARGAIRDAGISGQLEAFGSCPLNAHSDLARAKILSNGQQFRQKLAGADWQTIDFKTQTSGRLSLIELSRIDLISLFPFEGHSSEATTSARKIPRDPKKLDYARLIAFGEEQLKNSRQTPKFEDYQAFWKENCIGRDSLRDALNDSFEDDWKEGPFPLHLKRPRGERDAPRRKPAGAK